MNWKTLLKLLAPAILSANPKTAQLAPLIIGGIEQAENLIGAPGVAKKQHALALVQTGMVAAATITKVPVSPEEAVALADNAIDTVVGVINLVHKARL